MEEFKSELDRIKESLAVLISKLEMQDNYSNINQTLKLFQEELKKSNPDKNHLLSYLDKVFVDLINKFPVESKKSEEDKTIVNIINKFNIMCQSYIGDLKDEPQN